MKLTKEKIIKELSNDLEAIHNSSNEVLQGVDSEAMSYIASLSKKGKQLNNEEYYKFREKIWIQYIEKTHKDIENLLYELSTQFFVNVKDFRIRLNELNSSLKKAKGEYLKDDKFEGYVSKLEKVFVSYILFWNELDTCKPDLKNGGWRGFLIKLFLPFSIPVAGAYWFIISRKEFNLNLNLQQTLFWLSVILIVLYMVLLNLSKRHLKKRDDNN